MASCNDFELAVEMRIHGALPPEEVAALAAHLETCAQCRAFETLATRTETMMHERTLRHVEGMDWEALFRKTTHFIATSTRTRLLIGAVTLSISTVMMMLSPRARPPRAYVAPRRRCLGPLLCRDPRRSRARASRVHRPPEGARTSAEEHRVVLSLFAVDGLGHAEIAEILGIPQGTVGSRLHSARKRLATAVGRVDA